MYIEEPGFRAPELPHFVRDSVGKKGVKEKERKKPKDGRLQILYLTKWLKKKCLIIKHSADLKGLTRESCYARPNMDLDLHLAPQKFRLSTILEHTRGEAGS